MPNPSETVTPQRRALITIGLMAATLMQVLDQTIATVALPHMQATLGATRESVAWVLTSYIVASAITTPITGWLASRIGSKKLFLIATGGFTLTSMACGFAVSLPQMIIYRMLQGCFGAFLVPLSQGLMYSIYPREKHAQAMTIWGAGVMVGPILGPVAGGWLTDSFDWRYIFFINLPFGILAMVLALLMHGDDRQERKIDFAGIILLATGLAALQLLLDRGSQLDWFSSWEIRIELGIAISAIWVFAVHSVTAKEPLFHLSLFKDRNLVVALLYIAISGGVIMSSTALLAPMLQQLLGYSTFQAGLISMPRGIGILFSMLIAGRLIVRMDGRIVMAVGMLITALASWLMSHFSLDMDTRTVVISSAVQGLGFGLVFMPLNLFAFSTIADSLRFDGAALYSLMRSIGGAIGISVANAMIARNLQVSHSDLAQHFTSVTVPWLSSLPSQLGGVAAQMLDLEINRQATMIAYVDFFYLSFWLMLLITPLLALLRRSKHGAASADALAAME